MTKTVSWALYGEPTLGRSCGGCQACCTAVPVELAPGQRKPANVRCPMLRAKGCSIYARRPRPCWAWSCVWLFNPSTKGLRRPDHSGLIIDPGLDSVLVDGQACDVVQVWCDPKRPTAHRDPAFREWVAELQRTTGLMVLIRWNSERAMLLVPPDLTANGEWFEGDQGQTVPQDELDQRLAAAGAAHPMRSLA